MLSGEDNNEKFGDDVNGRVWSLTGLGHCCGRSSRWNPFPNEATCDLPLNVNDVARVQCDTQLLAFTEIARNAIQGHIAHHALRTC